MAEYRPGLSRTTVKSNSVCIVKSDNKEGMGRQRLCHGLAFWFWGHMANSVTHTHTQVPIMLRIGGLGWKFALCVCVCVCVWDRGHDTPGEAASSYLPLDGISDSNASPNGRQGGVSMYSISGLAAIIRGMGTRLLRFNNCAPTVTVKPVTVTLWDRSHKN